MKVSVLLALYNGEKYIRRSLDSVLNQTYRDIEVLIGFNGTVDNSKSLVSKFSDERIRIFDFGNDKGKAKTLNKLFKESKGDWIAIQDDDDIWLPQKLESQIKYCKTFDVIGTQIAYINETDNEIGKVDLALDDFSIKKMSFQGNNQIANTSAILRREKLEDVQGWRLGFDGIEDYDLWLRLIRKGCKFMNLNEKLVLHRIHSKSNFNTQKHDLSVLFKPEDKKYLKRLKLLKKIKSFFSF